MGVVRRRGSSVAVGVGLLLGVGASGAAAYSVSGGFYTGTATNDPSFTFAGVYTFDCPQSIVTYPGYASGAAQTNFTPDYGAPFEWCTFFGLPASLTVSGSQSLTVTGGPSGGIYTGSFRIPSGSSLTFSVPLAGCTVTVTGDQQFNHGSGGNVVSAFNLLGGIGVGYNVDGVDYTASGCPFGNGTNGNHTATFTAAGITIS